MSTSLSVRAPLRPAILAATAALTLAGIVASCAPPAQPPTDPRTIARNMMVDYGWGDSTIQFNCLNSVWTRESNWEWNATNPSSGAYGIPQSLPASKMAEAGKDWRTNPTTQIRWGLDYIKGRYGSPCGAWSHEQTIGWYTQAS